LNRGGKLVLWGGSGRIITIPRDWFGTSWSLIATAAPFSGTGPWTPDGQPSAGGDDMESSGPVENRMFRRNTAAAWVAGPDGQPAPGLPEAFVTFNTSLLLADVPPTEAVYSSSTSCLVASVSFGPGRLLWEGNAVARMVAAMVNALIIR